MKMRSRALLMFHVSCFNQYPLSLSRSTGRGDRTASISSTEITMTQANRSTSTAAMARVATKVPEDYDDFLSTLGDRDRQNLERHVTFCNEESGADHARLWKRLALALARLAPRAAQTVGQRAVRFYVTDGKYRQQIF